MNVWISNCCGAPMEHIDGEDRCGYCGRRFGNEIEEDGVN
jgi:hypothetical protein